MYQYIPIKVILEIWKLVSKTTEQQVQHEKQRNCLSVLERLERNTEQWNLRRKETKQAAFILFCCWIFVGSQNITTSWLAVFTAHKGYCRFPPLRLLGRPFFQLNSKASDEAVIFCFLPCPARQPQWRIPNKDVSRWAKSGGVWTQLCQHYRLVVPRALNKCFGDWQ